MRTIPRSKRVSVFLLVAAAAVTLMGSALAKDGEILATVKAGSYEIQTTPQGHELSLEGFGRYLVPGKPNLPAKIFALAVPPGAEVNGITFESNEQIVLPGKYQILPVPLPRVANVEDPSVYKKEKAKYDENYRSVYESDAPYPSGIGEFVREAAYRKYNLVDVRIMPFVYQPQSGKLVFHPNITVKVSYTLSETAPEKALKDNQARTEEIAKKIVFNYDQAQVWYPESTPSRGLHDFVIITLNVLTSAVQPLVDWEQSKGRTVEVVTTTWINSNYSGYDLAEKMRNFLRDKYPSGEWGIEDLLLVGHYDDVPMRRCWQDTGYGKPETDYYYAELSLPDSQSWDMDGDHKWGENSDPIDFYNEINVGRIPWSDASIVEHICNKSAAYEENDDPEFKQNILLLGAFFWPDTDNAVLMEYKVDEDIHPWMKGWSMTRMYEQGHSSYPMDYDLTYNNVETVWSQGKYAFVNWAGHGSPDACWLYYDWDAFVDNDTCNSLNDDYPSIIFADACSNSDTDYDNIGQMMLKQGGVGFLGATKVAYGMPGWNHPSDGSSQSLDYYWTTFITSGNHSQGESHQLALVEMYTKGLWYYDRFETFEWGAMWGNPDLKLECHAPLMADDYSISVTEGGVVNFALDGGTENADRLYLLLGSATGTSPGFNLPGGLNVPLNWDAFTDFLVVSLNTSMFVDFLGNLDGSGTATATLDTLGPAPHNMVGKTLTFAFVLSPPPSWNFVSNNVSVVFTK